MDDSALIDDLAKYAKNEQVDTLGTLAFGANFKPIAHIS